MDLQGYEGLYKVYNDGRVWSERRGIFLKPIINNWGYYTVLVSYKSKHKRFSLHRLIALHFISRVEGKDYINHKDGNKLNNNVSNLEWCTIPENNNHARNKGLHQPVGKRRLARDYVREIRLAYINGNNIPTIAANLNFHVATIREIVFGRKYKKLYPELISTWKSIKPEHGTHNRYCKGCRCQPCKEAHRKANKLYRSQLYN